MDYRLHSEGVYICDQPMASATAENIAFLKRAALAAPRLRARLCAHPDAAAQIHEMLIAMARDTYIIPHAHQDKSESFHLIEGHADLVLFDENGIVTQVVPLGTHASGRIFYLRIDQPFYHTIVIQSNCLVVHETTTGPFRPDSSRLAPWAPRENEPGKVREYVCNLRSLIMEIGDNNPSYAALTTRKAGANPERMP